MSDANDRTAVQPPRDGRQASSAPATANQTTGLDFALELHEGASGPPSASSTPRNAPPSGHHVSERVRPCYTPCDPYYDEPCFEVDSIEDLYKPTRTLEVARRSGLDGAASDGPQPSGDVEHTCSRRAGLGRGRKELHIGRAKCVHVNIYTTKRGADRSSFSRQNSSSSSDSDSTPNVNVMHVEHFSINLHHTDVQQDLSDKKPFVTTVVDWGDESTGSHNTPEDNLCTNRISQTCSETQSEQYHVSYHDKIGKLQAKLERECQRADVAEEAFRKERASVMKFIMRIEERDSLQQQVIRQAASAPDRLALCDVIKRLYSQLDVRLLAIDSGLTCLLDTPADQWLKVVEQQVLVGDILKVMLPEGRRQDVTWSGVTPCESYCNDVDLRVGKRLPDEVGLAALGTSGACADIAPTTWLPASSQNPFMSWPCASDQLDSYRPLITDVILLHNGRLVMADHKNSMLQVATLGPTNLAHLQTSRVPLRACPLRLAQQAEGMVAVTALNNFVFFVDATHPSKFVVARVHTAKQYTGVTSGGSDDTLIVSCIRSGQNPASIDVIQDDGTPLRTIVDSVTLPDLRQPGYLHISGGKLFVSDCGSNCVLVLEAEGGGVVDVYTHPSIQQPRQVVSSADGRCFVASEGCQCVMARSSAGLWSTLLKGAVNSEEPHTRPVALCHARLLALCLQDKDSLIVAWAERETSSAVHFYQIPANGP